jgi:DNA-binding GntR family transcriptional regulator
VDQIPKLSTKAALPPITSHLSALNKQSYSTRDLVYDTLKQQILSLELPPGTAISEKEISLGFQVSRTPVRESFVRLAQEGLLEVYPQRGTYVSLIHVDLVEEARFMREHLERAVIRLACAHFPAEQMSALEQNLTLQQQCLKEPDDRRMFQLDEEFHSTLFAGCNKSKTWTVIEQMSVHLNRSRMLRLSSDHHWDHLIEQHRSMVRAIQQQDADQAERLAQEHLHLTVTDLTMLRDTYASYFQ